jgi:phosphoribosyl 1,2-cyclic phosphodiesterase
LTSALRAANGRIFADDRDAQSFLAGLDFSVAGTYGGHSSCVEIETGAPHYVLCDLGSGVRAFGEATIARHGAGSPQTYHIFMSHMHWDHIMGLPFFGPAYIPGNRLYIYGGHPDLQAALRRQQEPPSFPVDFSIFRASIEFVTLDPDRQHDLAGMRVSLIRQYHGGGSYGYRFEAGGRSVVYSTDSEHKLADPDANEAFIQFFRDADVVVFDAMYSLADSISVKADWGHSSNIVGVELCQLAGARHLCLFHHEPTQSDEAISHVLAETRRFEEISCQGRPLRVTAAYDGMEIPL